MSFYIFVNPSTTFPTTRFNTKCSNIFDPFGCFKTMIQIKKMIDADKTEIGTYTRLLI